MVNPADLVEDAKQMGLEICEICHTAVIDGKCACTARAEAAAKAKAAEAEAPQEEVPAEEQVPQFNLRDALAGVPGSPAPEQLDAWKKQFRTVYVLPLSPTEVYIWRYLTRAEWMSLIAQEEIATSEVRLQEAVVNRALLWPKLDPIQMQASRAGLVSTLFGVIMKGSWFLEPEIAISLVQEL